jgi:hypothetical protein
VSDQRSAYDDGQLPWLQPVEDEDEPRGVSARKMLAAFMVVLLAALLVAGTFFWLGRRGAEVNGPPELIRAEPGPYKIKPPNPGGLDIAGESQTAFETSAGEDRDSQLNLNAQSDETVAVVKPAPKPEEPTAEKATPAPAATTPPTPAPSGEKGSVIQLGAFANRAQAERAWTALSVRFPTIGAMSKMVVPFPGGIRLRAGAASAADARQACQTLKAAGENCFVAQ